MKEGKMVDKVWHMENHEYPDHFANKTELDTSILKHLCPYIFKKDKIYTRNKCYDLFMDYHEKITNVKLVQEKSQLVRKTRKIFNNDDFFESIEGVGNYKYIGQSHTEGYELTLNEAPTNETKKRYIPDQHLKAINDGNESLYIWWHKDSEELAQLKGEIKWAIKVGQHNSSNFGARFANYNVAIPHTIKLGLVISCDKAITLEKAVHTTLRNRNASIDEEGSEWYISSVHEVLDILRFNNLII